MLQMRVRDARRRVHGAGVAVLLASKAGGAKTTINYKPSRKNYEKQQ